MIKSFANSGLKGTVCQFIGTAELIEAVNGILKPGAVVRANSAVASMRLIEGVSKRLLSFTCLKSTRPESAIHVSLTSSFWRGVIR